ncbi:MAG: TetR/AcrR family transcriptional regulator [Solirubrobacterales bacterium]
MGKDSARSGTVGEAPAGEPRAPLRRDAARNRDRLLAAAAAVFAENGLEAGVDDVAREAGVGTGTLYRHFPNKEALIDELVRDLLTDLLEVATESLREPDGAGLEAFLYAVGTQQSERLGCLPRLWSTPRHRDLMIPIREAATELLREAQRAGRVREDLAPPDLFALLWSLRGVIQTSHAVDADAWRRHLEILLIGIAPSEVELRHPPLSDRAVSELFRSLTV